MKKTIMLLIVLAILSGCASTNNFQFADVVDLQGGDVQRANLESQPSQKVEVVEDDSDGKKTVKFSTDPYATLGIMKTQAIMSGNVTIVVGVVPDIRFGEYFPGAVGGKCWAVKGDKEFYCQSLLLPPGADMRFRAAYIIEGSPQEVAQAKMMALSIRGEYLYDGEGREFKAEEKAGKDGKTRRKFISENGTIAYSMPRIGGLLESILEWNEYSTPEGILLSPLGSEEVAYIASINPQYKFIDKLIGTGNFSLKPDLVGIGAGLAMDVFVAMGAPATGWDYTSQLPSRRNMGIIMEYVANMRLASLNVVQAENKPPSKVVKKSVEKAVEKKAEAEVTVKPEPVRTVEVKKPKTEKYSAEVKRLAEEKISKLGFPEEVSLKFAKKVRSEKYDDTIDLSYGSRASVALVNGGIQEDARLQWPKNPRYPFKARVYKVDGFILYHLESKIQDVWWRT